MSAPPAYSIDLQDSEIIVRLNSDLLDQDDVSRFLDYLELKSIQRRSGLSKDDAAVLADEIDQSVWQQHRAQLQDE